MKHDNIKLKQRHVLYFKKVNWSAEEKDILVGKCDDVPVATGKFSSSLTPDKANIWEDDLEMQ